MEGQLGGVPFLTSLPTEGWTREQVVGEVTSMLGLANFKAPSGVCHKPEQQRVEVVTEVPHCTAATVLWCTRATLHCTTLWVHHCTLCTAQQ